MNCRTQTFLKSGTIRLAADLPLDHFFSFVLSSSSHFLVVLPFHIPFAFRMSFLFFLLIPYSSFFSVSFSFLLSPLFALFFDHIPSSSLSQFYAFRSFCSFLFYISFSLISFLPFPSFSLLFASVFSDPSFSSFSLPHSFTRISRSIFNL